MESIKTRACIVGGGPAGMMCGLLLARAGVDVMVIEKHGDFLRDFRGDTVHPSTLEVMHELGLLDEFLKLPHQEVKELGGVVGTDMIRFADFSQIHSKCRFVALMPQWHFLDFLAQNARRYPTFNLKMNTEAVGVIEEGDRVVGVKCRTAGGEHEIRADLVIGADGRGSVIRQSAGLQVEDLGAPMDIFWFRISREDSDGGQTLGHIVPGAMMVMLNRDEYWQCGLVIPKGSAEEFRAEGIDAFRERIRAIVPFVEDRLNELASFDDIKLLTVKVDRLRRWYREGLLCIGDSAHAMSPVGGVGINLAIQDAVATANILYDPLYRGRCTAHDLMKVQQRRRYPTRMTQLLQVIIQNHVVSAALASKDQVSVPWFMQSFNLIPKLRSIPAKLVGIGFQPEHIQCPERVKQPI